MTTDIPMLFPDVPLLWHIKDAVPATVCTSLIADIERENPAPVATSPSFRDQDRLIRDDRTLADWISTTLKPHLPGKMGTLDLLGINERLRLYRYRPGQRFSPHMDHWYQASPTTLSLLTVLVYLNEDFEGGETRFTEQLDQLVVPSTGSAIVFQHKVRHEGCEVLRGKKYALRTDVMYRAGSPTVVSF